MTVTKAQIVARVHEQIGFSKKETGEIVESIFEIIKSELERGQRVKVTGFGSFVVNGKEPRRGRNPQTGEQLIISGRRVLGFKPSAQLKKRMNRDAE